MVFYPRKTNKRRANLYHVYKNEMFDGELRYLNSDHGKYRFFNTSQQKVIENTRKNCFWRKTHKNVSVLPLEAINWSQSSFFCFPDLLLNITSYCFKCITFDNPINGIKWILEIEISRFILDGFYSWCKT